MADDRPRVLVVDDGVEYARVIDEQMPEFELLRPTGDQDGAPCLQDGASALAFLEDRGDEVDVVLLDMRFDLPAERLLPVGEGMSHRRTQRFQGVAILREIRRVRPLLPVVLLTSVEDLSLVDAAEELTAQSMTYFLGRDDLDALRIRINGALRESALDIEEADILWGPDPGMRAVRRRLTVLARGRMPVILEGGTGTGKSFLAERFIHANSGRGGPFVVLDLATLPRELIPAHLFGAVRGAYTGAVADRKGVFELAHGGTLFIDEIQNVPLEVQKQLLLVLQDRRVRPLGAAREIDVDVKVIAASNAPLDRAVAGGRFRPDLYMRLSPATRVRIPTLAERADDLAFLARRFAAAAAGDPDVADLRDEALDALGLPGSTPLSLVIGREARKKGGVDELELALPEPAWQLLRSHPWPGNVRELSMVVHNLVAFTLVAAVDAVRGGISLTRPRLQVDPGLVGELLAGSAALAMGGGGGAAGGGETPEGGIPVSIEAGPSLNAVANSVERQYFLSLFRSTRGDFRQMAVRLLGDPEKSRAVRLRFNQLGLKVRELTQK